MPYINRVTGAYADQITGDPSQWIAIESPTDIGALVTPAAVSLPDTAGAQEALRALQQQGVAGLAELLATPTEARRAAIEQAMVDRSLEGLTRQATDIRRDIEEGTFGRGVGLSTITADLLDRLNREQFDATTRARREAFLASGEETRAEQAAQLAALGQAASQGMTGLQAEANVEQANRAREQAGRQYGAQTAFQNLLARLQREQQGGQFTAELGSREQLERERISSAEDIANAQMLAGGITAGIGGLATLFGPTRSTISR